MPRIRSLRPDFWDDELTGALDFPVQVLYMALWNLADDASLLEADPRRIRAFAFRYKPKVKVEHVQRWLEILESYGRLLRYRAGGREYYVVPKLMRHQRPEHPSQSKLPRPPLELLNRLDDAVKDIVLKRMPVVSGSATAVIPGSRTVYADQGTLPLGTDALLSKGGQEHSETRVPFGESSGSAPGMVGERSVSAQAVTERSVEERNVAERSETYLAAAAARTESLRSGGREVARPACQRPGCGHPWFAHRGPGDQAFSGLRECVGVGCLCPDYTETAAPTPHAPAAPHQADVTPEPEIPDEAPVARETAAAPRETDEPEIPDAPQGDQDQPFDRA